MKEDLISILYFIYFQFFIFGTFFYTCKHNNDFKNNKDIDELKKYVKKIVIFFIGLDLFFLIICFL